MGNEETESMYGKIRVKIKGISPLLMNRITFEKLKGIKQTPVKIYDEINVARKGVYIKTVDGEEQSYIPAGAVMSYIIGGSKGYRLTVENLKEGERKSEKIYAETAKKIYAETAREAAYITVVDGEEQLYIPKYAIIACIIHAARGYRVKELKSAMNTILAGCIMIEPEKILLGHCNYEVAVFGCNIGLRRRVPRRFLKAKAKVLEWEAEFFIIYDRILESSLDLLQEIVEVSGRRAGLLYWRPQHRGQFGKFKVEEYSIIS